MQTKSSTNTKKKTFEEALIMDCASLLILLVTAGAVGYCGGKEHGFHKLLKALGLTEQEKQEVKK